MKEPNELRDLTIRYLKARASGDFAFIADHLSQTDALVFLGTGPHEWWMGHDTVAKTIEANMKADVKGVSLVAEDPVAYSEGTVGWVADRFKLRLPNGKEMPLRLTAVFRQEDGDWKIVLSHLST